MSHTSEQINSTQMPFRCDYCQHTFKHKRSRDRHLKIHTGDRRYKCNNCDSAFSRSDHLKIHMKTHDHMKPHQCSTCNRGYSTAAALTSHKQNCKRLQNGLTVNGSTRIRPILAPNMVTELTNLKRPLIGLDGLTHSNKNNQNNSMNDKNTHRSLKSPSIDQRVDSLKKSLENQKVKTKINDLSNGRLDNFDTKSLINQHHHQQHQQQVTCGLCGNKCASLDIHIRESHLHQLLFAGLLHNSMQSIQASTFANWQQLTTLPPPTTNPGLVAAAAAAAAAVAASSSSPTTAADKEEKQTLNLSNGRSVSSPHGASPKRPKLMSSPLMNLSPSSSTSSSPHQNNTTSSSTNRPLMINTSSSPSFASIPFLCNQCPTSPSFPDFESFRVHLKSHFSAGLIHSSSGPLVGPHSASLPPLPLPISHHHHHHGNSPIERSSSTSSSSSSSNLPCPYCESIISSDLIESHIINSHLGSMVSSFSCESCKKMFTKSDDLTKHLIEYHSHHLYQCSICREMFDTDLSLQVHFQVKHSNSCKVFKCSICNQLWSNQEDFKLHLKMSHFSSPNTNGNLVSSSLYHSHSHSHSHTHGHSHSHSHPHQHLTTSSNHNLNHNHYSSAFNNPNHHLPSSLVSSTSNLVNPFSIFAPKCQYFKCPFCPDEFHIEYLLEKHIQSVHNINNNNNNNNNNINNSNSNSNSNNHINSRKSPTSNGDVANDKDDSHNQNGSRSPSPRGNESSPIVSDQLLTTNCKLSPTTSSSSPSVKRKSSEIDIDIETTNDDSNHSDDNDDTDNISVTTNNVQGDCDDNSSQRESPTTTIA